MVWYIVSFYEIVFLGGLLFVFGEIWFFLFIGLIELLKYCFDGLKFVYLEIGDMIYFVICMDLFVLFEIGVGELWCILLGILDVFFYVVFWLWIVFIECF